MEIAQDTDRVRLTAAMDELTALKYAGQSDRALARSVAALELADRCGDVPAGLQIRVGRLTNLLELGLHRQAADEGGVLLRDVRRHGQRTMETNVSALVADAFSRLGEVNRAMAALGAALGLAGHLPVVEEREIGAVHNVAIAAMQRGLFEAAEPLFDRVVGAMGPGFPTELAVSFLHNRALLYAEWALALRQAGEAARAERRFEDARGAIDDAFTRGPTGMSHTYLLYLCAFVEAELGDVDAAERSLGVASEVDLDGQTSLHHSRTGHLARALVERHRGNPRAALDAAERAARCTSRRHDLRWEAEVRSVAARAHADLGEAESADEALALAVAASDEAAWHDRVYNAALAADRAGARRAGAGTVASAYRGRTGPT